jgi:hypothetical protein
MVFLLIPLIWLTIAGAVVAVCRMAARADAHPVESDEALAHRSPERGYSPRRPTTCGTVRSRILTSVHSYQLATYR